MLFIYYLGIPHKKSEHMNIKATRCHQKKSCKLLLALKPGTLQPSQSLERLVNLAACGSQWLSEGAFLTILSNIFKSGREWQI